MLILFSRSLIIIFIVLNIVGCNTVTIVNEHKSTTNIQLNDKESIVLLGRRHLSQYETELDYISCVGKQLSVGEGKLNVIPEQQFIDSMYPYFEASTAPMNIKKLDELIQHPNVSKKLAHHKIHYFIWIVK